MSTIETVGIIAKPGVKRAESLIPELLDWLEKRGIVVRCDASTAGYANRTEFFPREEVPDGADMVIVLGGDGTLLAAARAIAGRDTPLLPVNLGGLGFLTAMTVDELFPELERALRREHRIAKRRFLDCRVVRNEQTVAEYRALNDVVITKASIARMIDIEAFIDSQFMCDYKADGLIVSTATGSTAYSLSAGGPIIFPSVGVLSVTPICPHMLTNRPVIVPETSMVSLLCRAGDDAAYLTIDGQVGQPLKKGDKVLCHSSAHVLRLVRPPKMRFFDVLRDKLKWGER
ncbi:MAG: NAD(+)/NADH kinase [Acidobacteriales bacterium]|nr:NAD(+)/NADH kinase [Terriglobales bacterium]